MSKLKVFGGMTHVSGFGQVRCVIATTSQKKAAELMNVSLYHFRDYWCETGDDSEIDAAMSKPETPFIQPNRNEPEYKEV